MTTHLPPSTASLYIYSGIRNPEWSLSEEQRASLQAAIEASPQSPTELSQPSQLGYTGFGVNLTDPGEPATVREAYVYNGKVAYRVNDQIAYFEDSGQAIERSLLESARPEIGEGAYQLLLDEEFGQRP